MWVSNFEVMGPPTEMESETGVSEGMGGTVGEIGLTLGAGVIICGSKISNLNFKSGVDLPKTF